MARQASKTRVRSPGRNIRNHRYKTINAVRWQRGEKLDDLVDKSVALSQQSKLLYQQRCPRRPT